MKTNKVSGFKSYITEKKMEDSKNKYDKLIDQLAKLNTKGNEDVKQAIALLKRGRDLKEYVELVDLLEKKLKEDPDNVLDVLENLFTEK